MDTQVTAFLILIAITGLLNMLGLAVFLGVLAFITRNDADT